MGSHQGWNNPTWLWKKLLTARVNFCPGSEKGTQTSLTKALYMEVQLHCRPQPTFRFTAPTSPFLSLQKKQKVWDSPRDRIASRLSRLVVSRHRCKKNPHLTFSYPRIPAVSKTRWTKIPTKKWGKTSHIPVTGGPSPPSNWNICAFWALLASPRIVHVGRSPITRARVAVRVVAVSSSTTSFQPAIVAVLSLLTIHQPSGTSSAYARWTSTLPAQRIFSQPRTSVRAGWGCRAVSSRPPKHHPFSRRTQNYFHKSKVLNNRASGRRRWLRLLGGLAAFSLNAHQSYVSAGLLVQLRRLVHHIFSLLNGMGPSARRNTGPRARARGRIKHRKSHPKY